MAMGCSSAGGAYGHGQARPPAGCGSAAAATCGPATPWRSRSPAADPTPPPASQGFSATLNAIVANLPRQRQTMLFSATQTKSVKDLARLSLKVCGSAAGGARGVGRRGAGIAGWGIPGAPCGVPQCGLPAH